MKIEKTVERIEMPMTAFVTGDTLKVVGVACINMKKRLTDLGIIPGSKVQIIKNQIQGPLILYVRDVRIAIGRSFAQIIMCIKAQ